MKHRVLDLASEIDRASLPAQLPGFLYPVFEAISNSLHSIEDKYGDTAHEDGRISVDFDVDREVITVKDNGEGFSKDNLRAFLTPFTGNKLRRNGKGFGRFVSFKIFSRVFYASPTTFPDGETRSAIFEYLPLSNEDNLIELDDVAIIPRHTDLSGLTVAFHKPKDEYRKYFDFSSDQAPEDYSEEAILVAILDHFLLEFIQEKTPQNFTCKIGDATFNLAEYFSDSVTLAGESDVALEVEEEAQTFTLRFMQIDADKSKRHSLYFYADNRATSDLENIAKGLKEAAFEDAEGRRYNYLVAVTSDYFKATQSRDRIENLGVKIKHNGTTKLLKDALATEAKLSILNLEPSYTETRRSTMRGHVEELIALDPVLRRGLGGKTLDEFVNDRGITEDREQLARDLFIERYRSKFDFRKINSSMPFDELQKLVREKISADHKEALAVYVAYRNDVIRLLSEMLNRKEDGTVSREDAVHQLIYPRYKDSEEIDYAAHNLWLIDDDLAYAEYISSDRTPTGNKRSKGSFAHDVLVNSDNELLLVELKRPQKDKYDADVNTVQATDNPVQQLVSQIGEIRDYGGVTTSGNRKVEVRQENMVRGYILADWNDDLEKYLKDIDFKITNFGGPMAYKYYETRNVMIEVLAFDRLKDRAAKRNQVFVDILEGRTNFAGLKVQLLAGE